MVQVLVVLYPYCEVPLVNNSDFQPYLQALGAATAATNVYAVSAYAPITNLDAADMAYEWSYKGITSFNKVTMGQGELPRQRRWQYSSSATYNATCKLEC